MIVPLWLCGLVIGVSVLSALGLVVVFALDLIRDGFEGEESE